MFDRNSHAGHIVKSLVLSKLPLTGRQREEFLERRTLRRRLRDMQPVGGRRILSNLHDANFMMAPDRAAREAGLLVCDAQTVARSSRVALCSAPTMRQASPASRYSWYFCSNKLRRSLNTGLPPEKASAALVRPRGHLSSRRDDIGAAATAAGSNILP